MGHLPALRGIGGRSRRPDVYVSTVQRCGGGQRVSGALKPGDAVVVPDVLVDDKWVYRSTLVHLVERRLMRDGLPYWRVILHWPDMRTAFIPEDTIILRGRRTR
jgi:hypothetical protein